MNSTKNDTALTLDGVRLEIVKGLHSGVDLDIYNGEYSFGSNADADIILRDDGVLTRHAVLRLDQRNAYLEAVGGEVYVDDMKVAIGHGCRVRMPARLTIGEAVIRLIRPHGAQMKLGDHLNGAFDVFSQHPIKVSGTLIGGALAFVVLTNNFETSNQEAATLPPVLGNFSEMRDTASVAHWERDGVTSQNALEALQAKLSDVGITTVRLSLDDSRISANGRISEAQADEWTSVQRWYDKNYASSAILSAKIEIGELQGKAPVRLQAIWLGERPYIIPDNNMRYYEGSILESGWVLQKITSDMVVLAKNGETFALTYQLSAPE